jgi:arylformamidase
MARMADTSRFIDITQPFSSSLPIWPGDTPVVTNRTYGVSTVSELRMSTHVGTHVDAPAHFLRGAGTVDQMKPEVLIGPAWLVALLDVSIVTAADLDAAGIPGDTERVLISTRNSALWQQRYVADRLEFDRSYVSLHPSAAEWLVWRNIRLLGVDGPSIDPFGTEGFPVHHILLGANVAIIENLALAGVAPGLYRLICLPLLYQDGDGAPARVVLERI